MNEQTNLPLTPEQIKELELQAGAQPPTPVEVNQQPEAESAGQSPS